MSLTLGQMGDPADSSIPNEFQNSMAARIESAFNRLLLDEGMTGLQLDSNTSDVRDRRMLFVAISQGIFTFLADNVSAISINPPIAGETLQVQLDDPLTNL